MLLHDAVTKGEAEKMHEAYLTDRVKVHDGESQLFGTQFYKKENGTYCPRPIEDIAHLDERRAAFGLEPFSEYEQRMREGYK